jgi:hypothetical protein
MWNKNEIMNTVERRKLEYLWHGMRHDTKVAIKVHLSGKIP